MFPQQTCAKIPQDPRSWIHRIQDPGSCGILDLIFSFSHGILEILDPVTPTLLWDPRDPGSQTDKILPDPGDPGSSLSKLSWDLADLGSYTKIMSLYFDHPLHLMKFCFRFPIAMRYLNLSSVRNFNHTLIQPLCVELKTGSPCWPLYVFSIINMLLTGCGIKKMNAHFIASWSITVQDWRNVLIQPQSITELPSAPNVISGVGYHFQGTCAVFIIFPVRFCGW